VQIIGDDVANGLNIGDSMDYEEKNDNEKKDVVDLSGDDEAASFQPPTPKRGRQSAEDKAKTDGLRAQAKKFAAEEELFAQQKAESKARTDYYILQTKVLQYEFDKKTSRDL
jgi:hypothetical protein